MADWMPITTAPQDGTRIAITGMDQRGVECLGIAHWNETDARFLDDAGFQPRFLPSHWQPLPAYMTPD